MQSINKGILGLVAILLLAGWGCSQNASITTDLSQVAGQEPYNEQAAATINVANQLRVEEKVTVAKVTVNSDGWVVVHADKTGVPGEIIGKTAVVAGTHENVVVALDGGKITPIVHAIIHVDAGVKGKFEFPGADVPVTANSVAVSGSFKTNEPTANNKSAENKEKNDSTVSVDVKNNLKLENKPIEVKIEAKNTVKSFNIIAKNWEFSPATITVKKGDTVRLAIKSVDVDHGFKLADFNINQSLKPGQTAIVEFVADKTGSFSFTCNVFCGSGHRDMKGTLIVQ